MEAKQVLRLDKQSNGLKVNVDALNDILLNEKCENRPVCVVTISGAFRRGKSFMLNFFLRYLYHVGEQQKKGSDDYSNWLGNDDSELNGFSWRAGDEPETTGIMIWPHPIVIKRSDGEEIAVILMDTQGSFDTRQSINQVAITFAMSTLTSSVQICNISGSIRLDDLQFLDMFSSFGKLMSEESSTKPFQTLWFLIRDWNSIKSHPYGAEGGQSLLEKRFVFDDDSDSEDNQTRKRIRDSYADIKCFLMPFPGEKVAIQDEEDGEKTFKGQLSAIKPVFIEHLKKLVPLILSPDNLIIKNIGGKDITGQDLLLYFKTYAQTIRDDKIPEAKSLYEATAESGNLIASRDAKKFYTESMREVCGPSKPFINQEILDQKHRQISAQALEQFNSAKKLESPKIQQFIEHLNNEISTAYEDLKTSNEQKNMFNMWRTPAIFTGFWILTYVLSSIFGLIGITPLCNMFHFFATSMFFIIIAYVGMKCSGNFGDIISTVDNMTEQMSAEIFKYSMILIAKFIAPRAITSS